MQIYRGILAALGATLLLKIATVVPALVLADIIDTTWPPQPRLPSFCSELSYASSHYKPQ